MINLKKLQTAPILKEPWEHQIIDRILDEQLFNLLLEDIKRITPKLRNLPFHDGLWPFQMQKLGMRQEVINAVLEINRQLLSISKDILSKYSHPTISQVGYYSIPRFNFVTPFSLEKIHDDADYDDKSMIMVIYLDPEVERGTLLYKNNSYDSFVSEVEWKPNRAFVFCPIKNVTWHEVKSIKERFMMAFYYERLERADFTNRLKESFPIFELEEKIEWFQFMMSSDNFMIEF